MGGFTLGFILFIGIPVAVFFVILYFIIKAAVRNGIIEARSGMNPDEDRDKISQVVCPKCSRLHDMDYPKCPFCKHVY